MAPSIAVLGLAALMELTTVPASETRLVPLELAALELATAYGIGPEDALDLLEMSKDEPVPLDEHHRLACTPGAGWALEVVGLEVEP